MVMAYGEGIFGAEPTPMIAYLTGFIMIQLAIALGTYFIASRAIKNIPTKYLTRFAGGANRSLWHSLSLFGNYKLRRSQ